MTSDCVHTQSRSSNSYAQLFDSVSKPLRVGISGQLPANGSLMRMRTGVLSSSRDATDNHRVYTLSTLISFFVFLRTSYQPGIRHQAGVPMRPLAR